MRITILSSLFSKFLTAMVIIAMVLVALPVMPVHAASITVTTTADELTTNGSCSLREAIINANHDGPPPQPYPDCAMGTGADTIILQSGTTYTLSLVDSTQLGGDLDLTDVDGLTIQASGNTPAVIDANNIDRVIETTAGTGPLTLVGITITNGNAANGGRGGGIYYASKAALTLVNSTISNNTATNNAACGAGIYNSSNATLTISNSTFQGNSCTGASGDGGGLWKGTGGALNISGSTFSGNSVNGEGKGGGMRLLAGTATITNSTFANNTAGNDGGAIQVNGADVSIDFSTFSGNAAHDPDGDGGGAFQIELGSAVITASILANSTNGTDCAQTGGVATLTNTLVENNHSCGTSSVITGDPDLGALANNGGPTQTMAITGTSPAYNAASSCGTINSDQRGFARPQDGTCDLGAYELGASDAAPVVLTVVRADNNPTEDASSVDFTVIFSEAVMGVDQTDFSLVATDVTGASIADLSGSGAVYTVTVNTGTVNTGFPEGTIRLDVDDTGTGIEDLDNTPLSGGFTAGETYTILADVAPVVLSVLLADTNPTSAASVDFTVNFSEPVTGVDAADFTLTVTGVTGASISAVTATADEAVYTVTVNTGSGDGTIRLDVLANGTIVDGAANPLAGVFNAGEVYSITKSATFTDVPKTYWAWGFVERLYNAGITGGCSTSPLNYCPEDSATRAQMAVFIERGLHYPAAFTPPNVAPTFNDTVGHWAEDWIEALRSDGITGGCGPNLYCPEDAVTRAQMAVFLLKSKYGSGYTPPAVGVSTGFNDVPVTHWAAAWIKQLAVEGITGGCGPNLYCPEDAVTRAQMAVFLVKTFNLP